MSYDDIRIWRRRAAKWKSWIMREKAATYGSGRLGRRAGAMGGRLFEQITNAWGFATGRRADARRPDEKAGRRRPNGVIEIMEGAKEAGMGMRPRRWSAVLAPSAIGGLGRA